LSAAKLNVPAANNWSPLNTNAKLRFADGMNHSHRPHVVLKKQPAMSTAAIYKIDRGRANGCQVID
jgi:hypothetical protein